MKQHHYKTHTKWTGNIGEGTKTYRGYGRDHLIEVDGKPGIPASSDPAFRGDPSRYNPEDLLVASLSSCHMLWYLHLCATNHIIVVDYEDTAEGVMAESEDGGGEFVSVRLRPRVTIESGDQELARKLHHEAHQKCFIANSVKFPVDVEPEFVFATAH